MQISLLYVNSGRPLGSSLDTLVNHAQHVRARYVTGRSTAAAVSPIAWPSGSTRTSIQSVAKVFPTASISLRSRWSSANLIQVVMTMILIASRVLFSRSTVPTRVMFGRGGMVRRSHPPWICAMRVNQETCGYLGMVWQQHALTIMRSARTLQYVMTV